MVASDIATAHAMAQTLVPELQAELTVQRFWVGTHRDTVNFLALTEPIDADSERHLYDVLAQLYDRFPEAYIEVGVLNPNWYAEGDALSGLPANAEEIPLRAA